MTDLDDKLIFILTQFDQNHPVGKRWESVISDIKQAFDDAGYKQEQTNA